MGGCTLSLVVPPHPGRAKPASLEGSGLKNYAWSLSPGLLAPASLLGFHV